MLGGGIAVEGGHAGGEGLPRRRRIVQHHSRAHQADPPIRVARILPEALGEPIDHAANHLILLARRDRCRLLHLLLGRPRNGGGGDRAGALARRGQAIGDVDMVALGDARRRLAHLAVPGGPGGRVAQEADEVVECAAMVAAEVAQRGEIIARLRVARLRLERPAEQLLGLWRRRRATAQQHGLAQEGDIIGIVRAKLHRAAEGLLGLLILPDLAIGETELVPAVIILGIATHPLAQLADEIVNVVARSIGLARARRHGVGRRRPVRAVGVHDRDDHRHRREQGRRDQGQGCRRETRRGSGLWIGHDRGSLRQKSGRQVWRRPKKLLD